MKKLKRWICKRIGHNFIYYKMNAHKLRCCKRCMQLEQYKSWNFRWHGWYALVEYNMKNIKETFKKMEINL